MAPKRYRWECPHGCPAVLAPQWMVRDDVRRYCLPCSAKTGRLVERFSPVLDLRSAKARDAAAKRAARKRARARAKEAKANAKARAERRQLIEATQAEARLQRDAAAMLSHSDTRTRRELRALGYAQLDRHARLHAHLPTVVTADGGVFLPPWVAALARVLQLWTEATHMDLAVRLTRHVMGKPDLVAAADAAAAISAPDCVRLIFNLYPFPLNPQLYRELLGDDA